jgi:hypothetical protein
MVNPAHEGSPMCRVSALSVRETRETDLRGRLERAGYGRRCYPVSASRLPVRLDYCSYGCARGSWQRRRSCFERRHTEAVWISILASISGHAVTINKNACRASNVTPLRKIPMKSLIALAFAMSMMIPVAAHASWGVIAVDDQVGEKDPAYGVGGGDSKAEATKNAMKFCKEASGTKCDVAVTYEKCGAYASSRSTREPARHRPRKRRKRRPSTSARMRAAVS